MAGNRVAAAAIDELFRRHANDVLAYAARRVSAEDAEGVVAEVFSIAFRNPDRVPANPLPWLYRCAANQIMHVQRSKARRLRLRERLTVRSEPPGCDPSEETLDRLDAETQVAQVLATLSDGDAELLRLWIWEQLAIDDIAYILLCRPGTTRVRLHRARERFSEAFTSCLDSADVDPRMDMVTTK